MVLETGEGYWLGLVAGGWLEMQLEERWELGVVVV